MQAEALDVSIFQYDCSSVPARVGIWYRWSVLGLLLVVSAYIAAAPSVERDVAWPADGEWLILDSHTHTQFSDGGLTIAGVAQLAVENGCNALAITDHSDPDWAAATREYFEALENARRVFPQLVLIGGLEWNIPPYDQREHVNVLINPHFEADVLPRFKRLFESGVGAGDALRWLAKELPTLDDGVLFYNHPSRKDVERSENLADMLAWREVNTQIAGFEGGRGHQKRKPVGAYNQDIKTMDRWDPVVAELGGTWDELFDSGENIWGALAVSDYHNDNSDYHPCEFARTHVQVPEPTATGVLKGLRAGTFWADHGRILDRLELVVSVSDGPKNITPRDRIVVPPDAAARVTVHFSRGSGAVGEPLGVEIISNCATGRPELIAVDRLQADEKSFKQQIIGLKAGANKHSCYVRAQVR